MHSSWKRLHSTGSSKGLAKRQKAPSVLLQEKLYGALKNTGPGKKSPGHYTDIRGLIGDLSRGKSIYDDTSSTPRSGSGSNIGRPRKSAIKRRLGKEGGMTNARSRRT